MADQKLAPDSTAAIAEMLKSGMSEDDIAQVVDKARVAAHPFKAAGEGAVNGVVSGLLSGVTGDWTLLKGVVSDAVSMLPGMPPEDTLAFTKSLTDSFATMPADMKKRWDEGDIRDRAQMITELPTAFATGVGLGYGAARFNKPAANVVGRGLQSASEHPMGTRLASGSVMAGGLISGHPGVAASGALAMAAPEALGKVGKALRLYSGDTSADLAGNLPSSARTLDMGNSWAKKPSGIRLAPERPAVVSPERVPDLEGVPYGGTTPASAPVSKAAVQEAKESVGIRPPAGPKAEVSTEALLRKQGLDPNKVVSVGPVTSRADKIAPRMTPPPIQDSRISNIAPEVTKPVTTPPPTSPEQQGLRDNAASRYGSRKIPVGQTLRTANAEKRFASLLRENPEMSIEDAKAQALKETSDAEKANRVRASEDAYRRNKTQD